jgi:aspartyl-tRNA(Asn)/glutamyl-tRNA(Gln) amidotransferase subunit A
MTPIAYGNDGGGSIRIPASFCGVYGIKPTQGRVPRRDTGLASWHPVNFSQAGPLARTVRDAAILLQVMSGPHPEGDPHSIQEEPPDFADGLERGVEDLHIMWSPDLGSLPVDPEVAQVTTQAVRAFEDMGAIVESPGFHVDMDGLTRGFMGQFYASVAVFLRSEFEEHGDLLTDYVRRNIQSGLRMTAADYYLALAEIERFRARMRDVFSRYDLLVTPALAVPAFPVGQNPGVIGGRPVADPRIGFHAFTYPFNVSGNPAASVPCGFSKEGLPIGLQLVGHPGDEATVLRASAAFEQARPWADRKPPVS